MDELFKFVQCADPKRTMQFNIESKINPVQVNQTRGVDTFVSLQRKAFLASGYKLSQITVSWFACRPRPELTADIRSTNPSIGGL
jgi:hypothetical protein